MKKYHIEHNKGDNYWHVMYGTKWVESFRAKSRSKVQIQKLLDHIIKQSEMLKKDLIGLCEDNDNMINAIIGKWIDE